MIDWFKALDPTIQALLATMFTWGVTALGAALVFFAKRPSQKMMDAMLGLASGVMIAASFWSLLNPAIEMAEQFSPLPPWIPALIGFLAGAATLWGIDKMLPHLHPGMQEPEGAPTSWRRSTLLVLAITLHNIPEGLAVGVAFGALAYSGIESATFGAAVALAIGIGLQNFPEGAAVSWPLRRDGFTRWRAFLYGQASGMVEPLAGVVGAMVVLIARPVLPYALAFAAGAMIYVVAEELIPEANKRTEEATDVGTIGVIAGFAIMMTMDVALG